MEEFWVRYRLNGIQHIRTAFESIIEAKEFYHKLRHLCNLYGWELENVVISRES